MKDRTFTLFGAIAALLAVYVLLGGGRPSPPATSRPHTDDARGSGLAALARWLDSEDVPVFSLRRRYDWLHSEAPLPATGNLLIMSVPHFTPARTVEIEYLREWVARGNSVLVLAAFYNQPQWAIEGFLRGEYAWAVNQLLPVTVETDWLEESDETAAASDETMASDDGPIEHEVAYVPVGVHPLSYGVRAIERSTGADEGGVPIAWVTDDPVQIYAQTPVLTVMAGESGDAAALWVTLHGQGRIIVSALPEVFSNGQLARPAHARLAANIVNYSLDNGYVVFDDMHQGISALYDPGAFFSDPRLYKSLAFLIALWLVWLLGASSRFYLGDGAVASAPTRAAFIAATGGFLARSVRPATCAREMFSHFFTDLSHGGRYRGRPDLLWRRLAADARAQPGAVAELQAVHASLDNRPRRVDLRRIHNLMQAIRKELL